MVGRAWAEGDRGCGSLHLNPGLAQGTAQTHTRRTRRDRGAPVLRRGPQRGMQGPCVRRLRAYRSTHRGRVLQQHPPLAPTHRHRHRRLKPRPQRRGLGRQPRRGHLRLGLERRHHLRPAVDLGRPPALGRAQRPSDQPSRPAARRPRAGHRRRSRGRRGRSRRRRGERCRRARRVRPLPRPPARGPRSSSSGRTRSRYS
jgi:hypothetical protein